VRSYNDVVPGSCFRSLATIIRKATILMGMSLSKVLVILSTGPYTFSDVNVLCAEHTYSGQVHSTTQNDTNSCPSRMLVQATGRRLQRVATSLGRRLAFRQAHAVEQHAILRVHAVLGLLEDHALLALHHGIRGFHAALGWQAVQEQRLRARRRHELLVDLLSMGYQAEWQERFSTRHSHLGNPTQHEKKVAAGLRAVH